MSQEETAAFGDELFKPPYRGKIAKVLPTLFNMVELENRRGKKLGMEVGNARERVLIALFMYVYGDSNVEFPASTDPNLDVRVNGFPVSIKTRSAKGFSGVKLTWTVDQIKIDEFLRTYTPSSYLLYVNIVWGGTASFFLMTPKAQMEIKNRLTLGEYVKTHRPGTNPRGVELSAKAMRALQGHPTTQKIPIRWRRDPSLLVERTLYRRWIDLWDSLS